MLAYKFDEITKEYLGTQIAQINPLEGGYLLPANSTFTVVPDYDENEIAVFRQREEEQTIEKEVSDYDEEGNPIIIEYEDIEVITDYDEEGNPIGTHEITVIKKKQQTHIETETIIVIMDYWVIQPDFRGQLQVKLDDITFSEVDYIGNVKDGYQFITNEIFENYLADKDRYKVINGVFTDIINTPEYEEIKRQKEAERVANLRCTKRVFVMMLEKLGFDYFEQIKPLIESNRQAQLEWDLCVELERRNALLDIMAAQMGVTSEQLDNLFKAANGEITEEEFLGIEDVE